MKKIMLIALVAAFGFASNAAAYEVLSSTTPGKLTLGSSMTPNAIEIGLSPKVEAKYATDGTTDATAQWYAITTVHPGGNMAYGTAQNVNNIYQQGYTTGEATSTIFGTMPTTKASEAVWLDNWSL